MDIQIYEAQRIPNRLNPSRTTQRHMIKLSKVKIKNFKNSEKKEKHYI